MERLGAVVADRRLIGQVPEDEHRVDNVVLPLGEDRPHVAGRPPAAQQGRPHDGGPEVGRPQVGDGGGQHLPVPSTMTPGRHAGGPAEQRQQIAAVGLVAHGPERVDAGAEEVGIVGVLQGRDRIEGQILGLGHAGDPTGGDDGA